MGGGKTELEGEVTKQDGTYSCHSLLGSRPPRFCGESRGQATLQYLLLAEPTTTPKVSLAWHQCHLKRLLGCNTTRLSGTTPNMLQV